MNSVAEVIEIDADHDIKIVEFSEFESMLAEFKSRFYGVVYDLNDKKQEKQARSDRYAIAQVISSLDKRHKDVKEPLLRKSQLLDGERKRIKDQLLEIQDGIKSQIEAHEEMIKRKAAQLQSRIDEIHGFARFSSLPTADCIQSAIDNLKAIEINDTFEDRKGDAALAKDSALTALESMLKEAKVREQAEREAEAARIEAERQRKEEERQRIEAEAKERADREAKEAIASAERRAQEAEARAAADQSERERMAREQAEASERRAKEAEARAEQAKADAEARAQQEAARIKAEQEAEAKRVADEKAQRERDQEHRRIVIDQAVSGLMNFGLSQSVASAAIKAIATGNVPHAQINF